MRQHRVIFWLIFLSAPRLNAQSSDEEQRKAKLAAERVYQGAQSNPRPTNPVDPQSTQEQKRSAEAMHALIAGIGGLGAVVRDKPYSAEAITETVQTLGDGNRIIRHNVTKLYRDHSGRTRREQTIETLGPASPIAQVQTIVISDPVASVDYILDPTRRAARKFPRFEVSGASHPGEGEKLGKRQIEGLDCMGTRSRRTIPAGEMGNERPIVIVTESWYSPAIEALVRSTTSDPRFGDTSYVLRNIVLSEPNRALFEPPPDYKVEFEGRPGAMMNRK